MEKRTRGWNGETHNWGEQKNEEGGEWAEKHTIWRQTNTQTHKGSYIGGAHLKI